MNVKNRKDIAKKLDELMSIWRKIDARYKSTSFNDPMLEELYISLVAIETEINALNWVLTD